MKLAYIIAIVTVLLNQAFGTYFKKLSEIKKESPSTKLFQSHKLDENLIQTNKSDSELNGSETRHLVIVKLPKGKDNKYIDHLNDRIFPLFPKDVLNSNAGHIFDGATDKRCAEDVIKNNDTILNLRGRPVSLPGANSEASKKANLNQKSLGDSYNKAKTTQYAHVFKRPGSYNDRPSLFNRPELIIKLDPSIKPSKKVSEIYQSPLGIYQRWKPTTGLYERPQSPFGVGYKDRKKGYEKPPGIPVTDYRRPILFNRGRHAVNPLKVIPNKDVGFESNPGYYPSSPFNDRFSSARIFGKTNKQYNFPKVLITSKTGENIFEPKLELKKKYITPMIGRNEGINKGLLILPSLLNKAKGVGNDENKAVTQKPVSYRRNKEQNIDNNGSKRIDLLRKNYSDEVLFTDPDLGSKNSSSKVIGLGNTESGLFEGANDKKSDLVYGINDIDTDLIEGMNDKENNLFEGTNDKKSELLEGMNDKENNLFEGTNDKKSELLEGMNDKENNLFEGTNDKKSELLEGMNNEKNDRVDGVNNKESDLVKGTIDKEGDLVEGMDDKESDLVEGMDDKESDLVEGMDDIENDLVEGMNDEKNNLVDGVNDKESDIVERMDDKENNPVEGMNDIENDLVEGMNDEKNNLVDGVNDKESDIVERMDDKENNLVEGMNDIENDLVEGMNDEKNNLVDGVNDKESDIVERMDDNENNLVEGMNDIETDLVEGINDKKNYLVDGVNDKESDIVKGKISKESNLALQTKLEEVLSKNQVNDEALIKKSLNHTSNEQSMSIKLKDNERAFVPSAEISTNVIDGEIKPSAINEINNLKNEETTTFNYIDENINDKGNYGKLYDNCRNTTSFSSNNNKDNRPVKYVTINTRNYSEKEDKNKNMFCKNESMSQLSNISPPYLGNYAESNESNIVSDLVKKYDQNVATTPLPFMEISIPKAIHESLLNEHNLMHTTDKSFVEISKNSADSNISNIFSDDHKYESKETNARNEESRSDYLSYSTTIDKEDPLPSIFNYSQELPKVVPAPEIIDYPPHELVEGQFVKLQPELIGRSDSESYIEKDMYKNFKNYQMSEVHDDKLEIPEKDKREYLFEEPVQHYTSENLLNLGFNNFSPKNELYDTYFDYVDDLGKSRPPVLSSIMEDFPSSLKSKAVDDSLILHDSNIDETVGSLDITKGYQTKKSENINVYEASGSEPNFDSSHLESDTISVNEFKRRGSYDEFPPYEYIKLNNPNSQLKNIRREDNSVDTTNYGDIARENSEDRTVAQTIEDTNSSNDFYKTTEVKKIPSIYKYSKENLDQVESVDSYTSENPQSYTESEKHIINRIFHHIKLQNDNKSEYENNLHSIPKLINNYIYQETTDAGTDTEDMPLNTESSKCLSCDYGILRKSKITKESDEKYQIINDNSSQSPKQICIRIDDKGDIKEDMMNLLYQVLKNKTLSTNNSLANKKLGDDSVENEGKEKISANIFNLLVRHLNNVNARKQLQENYQNLLTKNKTEIDEDKPILDLSDQSSERKETYNHRFFKIPNKFQRETFSDVHQSESKEFPKGVGTVMSSNESNDSRELLNVISKTMRKVKERTRPTYRNKKMCGKKKCNDFIGRRTELMKNIISSLHEYVIEDKATT